MKRQRHPWEVQWTPHAAGCPSDGLAGRLAEKKLSPDVCLSQLIPVSKEPLAPYVFEATGLELSVPCGQALDL